MAQKKVVIILPTLVAGGTERAAAELANYLVRQNVKVEIFLMYQQPHFFTLDASIKVIEPEGKYRKRLGKFLYIPYLLWFLRSAMKKSKPDSILLLGYILFGLLSSVGLKSSVFVSYRASPNRVRFPNNPFFNLIYIYSHKLLSYRVDGAIAQTETAALASKEKLGCPVSVIPNFLKEMKYYPELSKENIIITVGRAVPEKGQKYFIEVVRALLHNNYRFLILGDGPELLNLKSYAKDLQVSDRIEFTGFTKEVDLLLAKAKIFVFTSLSEGYPNAIIEAMAHGCVAVSFDCVAGPSDIIEHGYNGYLTQVGDVNAMKNYIQNLIDDNNLFVEMSKKAILVRDSNSIEQLAKAYMDFLLVEHDKLES